MMKVGDRIKIKTAYGNDYIYIVEKFRHCLGIFPSDDHRKAGHFLPLCNLYKRGPDSKEDYIPNYGSYYTNKIQGWTNIPSEFHLYMECREKPNADDDFDELFGGGLSVRLVNILNGVDIYTRDQLQDFYNKGLRAQGMGKTHMKNVKEFLADKDG